MNIPVENNSIIFVSNSQKKKLFLFQTFEKFAEYSLVV